MQELQINFIIFDIVLNVMNILIALYLCAGTAIRHCDEHKGWLSPNLFNCTSVSFSKLKTLVRISRKPLALRPFHTEREEAKRISDTMMRWNKTTDFYGCFCIGHENSLNENAILFFTHQSDKSFQFRKAKTQAVQSDLSLGHVTRAAAVEQIALFQKPV